MTGIVNRTLLAVAGAVLLAAGVVLLTAVPPLKGRAEPLLTAADRRRYLHAEGWAWWVLIAALVVCLLLALWWLLAQLKRARLRTVAVDTGDGAYALLRGRALSDAVAAEAGALDGVAGCRAVLRGRRGSPALRVAVELEPHAVPADTLAGLAGPVLTHARASANLPGLPAEARFKVTSHRARRVS
ncbi:alkaline shock response membrane anchor protein AmaP [Streptomyces yangpuensis]|uniref:Alkaline shock response membrane anchor protein AmaP n=1 Tax=Streptomyces yangpuensis TaxID=1648182 RepID=A0ABY5PTH3_9ACTN|nr:MULTISPECIES: alkaline shock response membrane anchor protein AmaP [Streptomyces]MBZ9595185.1 alkaline shock response membrane anchor protein AmaP [Streptomyces erythrochromogenes]UUY47215.1 alkaline shock response membrane anchor protein AmaP [Streptomyces yangpuensis]